VGLKVSLYLLGEADGRTHYVEEPVGDNQPVLGTLSVESAALPGGRWLERTPPGTSGGRGQLGKKDLHTLRKRPAVLRADRPIFHFSTGMTAKAYEREPGNANQTPPLV